LQSSPSFTQEKTDPRAPFSGVVRLGLQQKPLAFTPAETPHLDDHPTVWRRNADAGDHGYDRVYRAAPTVRGAVVLKNLVDPGHGPAKPSAARYFSIAKYHAQPVDEQLDLLPPSIDLRTSLSSAGLGDPCWKTQFQVL
jgi:hypothetical protein